MGGGGGGGGVVGRGGTLVAPSRREERVALCEELVTVHTHFFRTYISGDILGISFLSFINI